MKKLLALCCIIALVAAFMFGGCGSDKDTTTNGDDYAALALGFQGITQSMVQLFSSMAEEGFDYLDADSYDFYICDYYDQDCWWFCDYYDSSSYMVMAESDSIHFSDDSGCQQYADSNTTGLKFRFDGRYNIISGDTASVNQQYYISTDCTDLDGDYSSISGNFEIIFSNAEGADSATHVFTSTYQNVEIDIDSGDLPVSGTMNITMLFTDTSDGSSFNVAITLTFNETGYNGSMVIEGTTYTWSYPS